MARPLDVVSAELLLSASQAFLVGVTLYMAVGVWSDRSVGVDSVALVLGLLGLAVGGGWLYWLMGGTGWPLAAANVPTAMFLGFVLLLGIFGQEVIQLDAPPLVLAGAASIYGIVCGVFLDSPRRWRWDQRQKLREGTEVPRVSGATRAFMARVPRSLPSRSDPAVPTSSVVGAGGALAGEPTPSSGVTDVGLDAGDAEGVGIPYVDSGRAEEAPRAPEDEGAGPDAKADASHADEDGDEEDGAGADRAAVDVDEEEPGGIVLPTSVEPKAQRSPWAWASPPEWNRDEDDLPPSGGKSGS